jgi:primary-amine oxidase
MSSCGAAAGCLQPQPASGEDVDLGYEHEQPDEQQQSDEHHNCPVLKPPPFLDSRLDSTDTVAADSAVKAGSGVSLGLSLHSAAHPLDPLTPTEIAVAIASVRAEGDTPEVRDGMRFVEVVLNEPGKNVVALADSYFFPPYQPILFRSKASKPAATISSLQQQQQLPPRQARLVVYNKKTNTTSIWLVELSNQVLNAPSAAHRHHAKILSSVVVPDVQPPMMSMQNVRRQ